MKLGDVALTLLNRNPTNEVCVQIQVSRLAAKEFVRLQNAKLLKFCLNEERDKFISFVLLVVESSLFEGFFQSVFSS